MAKIAERQSAKIMFVEQGKPQKEIAFLIGVTEKTISNWVNKFNWKDLRDARLNAGKTRVENVKKVISSMTEKRLTLIDLMDKAQKKGDKENLIDLQKQAVAIDDGISKWNKTLENLDKENRISLSVYLEVMDSIFKALQNFNAKLYIKTIDFQEHHLSKIADQYS